MVVASSLRSTHDKQLLELTCLFPTRSTTFGRLLLIVALAHRRATCSSLESISVPALLCTDIEISILLAAARLTSVEVR
jgi:hypothetical protein